MTSHQASDCSEGDETDIRVECARHRGMLMTEFTCPGQALAGPEPRQTQKNRGVGILGHGNGIRLPGA